jgi:hypothetical protein
LEAFGLFYKDNSGPVFRALLAGTFNRAAAEDPTAEAFARALAHWDMVASHPNPQGLGYCVSPGITTGLLGEDGKPAGRSISRSRRRQRPNPGSILTSSLPSMAFPEASER